MYNIAAVPGRLDCLPGITTAKQLFGLLNMPYTYNHIVFAVALLLGVHACTESRLNDETDGRISDNEVVATDPGITKMNGVLYYQDSAFSGELVEFYSHGVYKSRTPYYQGREHGVAESWYPDGTKMEERVWVHGAKDGTHKGWWENGMLRFEYQFKNDVHEGEAKEWFADGTLYRDFHYVAGQEEGSQMMWNADGSIKANYVIKNGRRYGSMGAKPCGGSDEL